MEPELDEEVIETLFGVGVIGRGVEGVDVVEEREEEGEEFVAENAELVGC